MKQRRAVYERPSCKESVFGKMLTIETMSLCALYIVVVVVSHIQRIGCQPEKNYFTRWPVPLVVC